MVKPRQVVSQAVSTVFAGALAFGVGACSGGSSGTDGGVVAAFYPLQFVAERVTGGAVANLTPGGAEPHDVELSARDLARLHDAQLVVYLGGFAPAIDDAVVALDPAQRFDVAVAARLLDAHHDDHADEGDADHGDHDHGDHDPHFWLDPTRLADVAVALAERLGEADPDRSGEYAERADALAAELTALDAEFQGGLADCAVTTLVTSHTAFGYLAERYGFEQIGIAGLSPQSEPSAGTLADVTDYVTGHGVTTVYYEALVDPAVARTVAAETGAATAMLDPLEALSGDHANYLEAMRANLATMREGQGCR